MDGRVESEYQLADREQGVWVVLIGIEHRKKLFGIWVVHHRLGQSIEKLEPARRQPERKRTVRRDWVVRQRVTQCEDI